MELKHTPGPWRWEINMQSKSMHLVGGRPMFDLTIMNFARWGMGSAVATLRDTSVDGMNIMYRLPDRRDWIAPFPNREHHADWCADVLHPDMRLMAAAPDLLDTLIAAVKDRLGPFANDVDAYYSAAGHLEREMLRKQLIVIAKARGKSTFGNDWMEALS